MDPISAEENARAIIEQKKQDEKFHEIIVSCRSLSRYEAKNIKTLLPQIIATVLAASFHIVVGIALAFSAILLPQLKEEGFPITEAQQAWVASVIVLVVPLGAISGGFIMDAIGRLNTVKLATIPGVIGWILIAQANSVTMLIFGRLLTGLASALGTSPAIVYITEIARADMRGSLISFAPAYASLGMVIAFLKGWFLNWRVVAWTCNVYTIVPCLLIMFIPESPAWLVSKGRIEQASKSLAWINQYQPQPENKPHTLAEMQLAQLQKEHRKKVEEADLHGRGVAYKVRAFLKPTGYKPLVILIGLFLCQQFSGIYITLFHSVEFFRAVGSTINAYLASVLLSTVRLFMSIADTYMLRTFSRRPLIMISGLGMAACMLVSGLFTMWIHDGTTALNWVPVAALIMYVVTSMVGLLPIPWTMTAELFPIEIRGVAHSIAYSMANVLMFTAVQNYENLKAAFGGVAGIQFFFAVVSIVGMVYTFVFVPETHRKKLTEIEEYFNHNTIYLGQSRKGRTAAADAKANNEQNEKLMNNLFNRKHYSEACSDAKATAFAESTKSLSRYEKRNLKNLLPQIMATTISTSGHITVGIGLAYSAVLIPQLEDKSSDIAITKTETSWIALATSPAVVYITEIARKDMRGSLLSFGPSFVSLGMVVAYLKGWLLQWRTIAWLCNLYIIVPFLLLFLIPESPIWLISRGRFEEAKKALLWLHKHQPQPPNEDRSFADLQLELLVKEDEQKKFETKLSGEGAFKEFLKPTGYKPLLIISGVFFFQQFSGIYIFLFYSVTFFEAVGTSMNPYVASIWIGVIRLVMSIMNTWMLKRFTRRILIMISASGMAVSTFISGLFTYWIKNGTTQLTWVPVMFLLLYVIFSMVGLLTIPWTMTAELFPLKIRSLAHSISTSIVNLIMFAAVQNYVNLEILLGGSAGVQWFFSGVSAAAVVFTFVFLPETHRKKLSEIEDYFKHNTIYLGQKRKQKGVSIVYDRRIPPSISSDKNEALVVTILKQLSSQVLAQQKTDEKYFQILGSAKSLSNYEEKNFKSLTPQLLAAILVSSFHVSIGISLAYSAILLPQLKENPEFEVSESEASWIASIVALTTPAGSLVVGFLMDHFGRLNTLVMASVPGIGGCLLTAFSTNVAMLISGRGLIGFASAIGSSPAIVYLTEIARKDMRGSLISFAPALTSLGMVVTFIMGSFMNWKQVAWFTNIFIVVPCVLVFFIPESPAWLVSKNRIEEAKKSLMWINKYQPQPENRTQTLAELQLALLQKEHELKMIELSRREGNRAMMKVREFIKPTGYKPLLILVGLFFFQQFSGIFIFLFYSIAFFTDVGSTFNPYVASVFIGVVRFIMSLVNTYVLRTFGRRPLVLISCVGMSLCVCLSGVFTRWIENGTTTLTWVPVVCLLLFVVTSMIGLVPIPYTMTAELFPLEIRGVAHSVSIFTASILMFISLQLYPLMYQFFNGIAGVQAFFAGISLLGVIYVYIFLPETHGKKLSEIEDYFRKNIVFIGQKSGEEEVAETTKFTRRSIVKKPQDQEEFLW
ncbi:facilitated trehalose transporter Tret1 [Asbolus verrucosus]|uniref:Facilitated trehalose transporter Tret1 n=1 Tax=Asbolus verrucosus TaxID=1661398 RepID=A0A482VZF5_ASBVE|nr:facilitated trehalose transporter Tret1 [Asbolus verrucosus]